MTDTMTNEPLTLRLAHTGGALLWLPYAQLDQVRALFDQHKVNYWWNEIVFDATGKNPTTSISLSKNEDAARVQTLLDAVP